MLISISRLPGSSANHVPDHFAGQIASVENADDGPSGGGGAGRILSRHDEAFATSGLQVTASCHAQLELLPSYPAEISNLETGISRRPRPRS